MLHEVVATRCPVNSHNEWDPLEEVVVGHVEGAVVPPAHPYVYSSIPRKAAFWLRFVGGWRYPSFLLNRARKEVADLVALLEGEGITVRRPEVLDGKKAFSTPGWRSKGFCLACPRDCYLVLGDEILETPSPWRSRYFEAFAYRKLFKAYFRDGARWTSAPKPELPDELYDARFTPPAKGERMRYVINEFEPVFDGADFARCGRDLFVTQSNVTNATGIEWLRRHLGDRYRIHELETLCRQPMHIDSTFVPLGPGRVMINPAFLDPERLPQVLRKWEILIPPEPEPAPGWKLSMASPWLSLNVLMLDEKRVVVEASQKRLIRQFREWGLEPLPLEFSHFGAFGGSFHCATLDIRRRGELRSYFD